MTLRDVEHSRGATELQNKELKLTKPSIMELRSLTLCSADLTGGAGRAEQRMTIATKAILAWLLLFVVMFVNGAIRVLVLQPQLGEDRARQIASLSGVALVLLVSWLFVRSSPGASSAQLWRVGVGWLIATVAIEFLFGHLISGQSWRVLFADYNILRGRLWSLILISVCLGPWFWGTVRARG